ncbi:MAG: hypothetical protein WBG92_13710 [Thiohalocapsa sp.]
MRYARRFFALPLALSIALPISVLADQVTDQIDAGRRAYEAGDSRVAIQALQFAVAAIETDIRQQQLRLLPEPLPGWTADDAVAGGGGITAMIAGTNLARSYRNEATDAKIQISVTADSPLLSIMGMVMATPMLMQADARNSPYAFEGFRGMTETTDDGTVKITLMVGSRILVQIEGSNGADRQVIETYLKAMKLNQLEKALLG